MAWFLIALELLQVGNRASRDLFPASASPLLGFSIAHSFLQGCWESYLSFSFLGSMWFTDWAITVWRYYGSFSVILNYVFKSTYTRHTEKKWRREREHKTSFINMFRRQLSPIGLKRWSSVFVLLEKFIRIEKSFHGGKTSNKETQGKMFNQIKKINLKFHLEVWSHKDIRYNETEILLFPIWQTICNNNIIINFFHVLLLKILFAFWTISQIPYRYFNKT